MSTDRALTTQGIGIWLICASFFLYEFFLRTIIGTFQHPIMADLDISTFKFSLLSSTSYQIIYGLMQIPAGIIVCYYGLRKTLFIAILICSVSSLGFAVSHEFATAIFFRIVAGLGSSFGFICLLVCVFDWLPNKKSAFFIGMSQFIGTIGPMCAAGPINNLAESAHLDWRFIFIIISAVGVLLAILVGVFVKNNSDSIGKYQIINKSVNLTYSLKVLFKGKQPFLIALFSAGTYFFIEYLSENEGKNYISLKGFSTIFASYMITIAWVGYAIGCPLLGYISDKFRNRKRVLLLAGVAYILGLSLLIVSHNSDIITVALFLLGVGASGQSIGFAIMAEQFKKHTRAIGLAFNNALITGFAAFNAPIIGYIFDTLKYRHNGLTLNEYNIVFVSLTAVLFLCIFIPLIFIKETYCKSSVDYTYLSPVTAR